MIVLDRDPFLDVLHFLNFGPGAGSPVLLDQPLRNLAITCLNFCTLLLSFDLFRVEIGARGDKNKLIQV